MIATIILNYKTWETTINCIESIKNTSDGVKIYVVDNDSPNNSYDILLNKYKNDVNIDVIQSGMNLGYAKGNNVGATKAINDGYEILLFTNNDIIFEDEAIKKMANDLNRNDKVSSISPLIKSLKGEIESLPIVSRISTGDYVLSFTRLNKFIKLVRKESPIKEKYELKVNKDYPLKEIYKFSGCCFMIKSQVFKEVGMFDDGTFMYFEEDILCHKLEERGYKSFHRSDAIIQHHHGKTTGSNNFFVDSEMFKSEMYYFAKYREINFILLMFLYFDRIVTPLIKMLKKKYKVSFKDYVNLIQITIKTIIKYKFTKYKNINMEEWNK